MTVDKSNIISIMLLVNTAYVVLVSYTVYPIYPCTRNTKEDVVKDIKRITSAEREASSKFSNEKIIRRNNEKKKTQLRKQQRQRKREKHYA